jgi:purine-binding chemotaxis protein CheW
VQINFNENLETKQFLTFFLANEEYGVRIMDIQEVRGWEGVNALPRTPKYVAGIISLRNEIVPIIDLRQRLDLESRDYDNQTVVAILKVHNQEKEHLVGIVVDGVSDVLTADTKKIKPAPDFGQNDDDDVVSGLYSEAQRMVILINANRLISHSELASLDNKIKMYSAMAAGE